MSSPLGIMSVRGISHAVETWLGKPKLVGITVATNGSGVPSITSGAADGLVTVTQSTNTYTITLPEWKTTQACIVTRSDEAISFTKTVTPANGTIVVAFGAAYQSKTFEVLLLANGSSTS